MGHAVEKVVLQRDIDLRVCPSHVRLQITKYNRETGVQNFGLLFPSSFFLKKIEYIVYKYTRVNVLRCIHTREKSKSREITRHTGVLRVATQLYRESSRHHTSSFSESTIPCARAHVCVCVCVGLVS